LPYESIRFAAMVGRIDPDEGCIMTASPTRFRAVCGHDCPDMCSLRVTVEDGRIVRVEGDASDPFTDGFVCAKVTRAGDLVHSPERLLRPLRRAGAKGEGRFEPIGWDEALGEIARRWTGIIAEDGPAALLGYAYSAHQGKVNRNLPNALFEALGATRLIDGTVCDTCASVAWEATVGPIGGTPPAEAARSDLILAWGADLIATNVHFWTMVEKARRAGARLIVIDPRRTRTAARADWHLQVPVGADAALALSVMHALVRDGACDRAWLAAHAHGFDRLEAEVLPRFSPAAVEAAAGIPAADIEKLAAAYGGARAPYIRIGQGMSRNARGGAAIRAVALLPGLVGAYGKPGGGAMVAMNSSGALDTDGIRFAAGRPAPRSVNHSRLGRALLEMGDPPIRALFVAANNPAVTCPDTARVRRGLAREDLFTVVHSPFLNDTALHADIVLPAATYLETTDVYASYGQPRVQFAQAVKAPEGEAKSNAEVTRLLARRMGLDHEVFALDDRALVELMLGDAVADRAAFWAGKPVDLDLPRPGEVFATPTGRLEFHSETLAAEGLPALPDWHPDPQADSGEAGRFPLRLLTAPGHFLAHTAFSGVAFLRGREGEPSVMLHPEDAAARGLAPGERVEAFNELGRIGLRLAVGTDILPGTALIVGQRPGADAWGGTVNLLCADDLSDLGEGATYQDTRLDIRRAAAPA
jgi:anaerobic selenocysteine-containing dehydrogenase